MSDGGRPDVDGQSVSHREEAPSLQMNHVPISLQRRRSLSCFHTTSPRDAARRRSRCSTWAAVRYHPSRNRETRREDGGHERTETNTTTHSSFLLHACTDESTSRVSLAVPRCPPPSSVQVHKHLTTNQTVPLRTSAARDLRIARIRTLDMQIVLTVGGRGQTRMLPGRNMVTVKITGRSSGRFLTAVPSTMSLQMGLSPLPSLKSSRLSTTTWPIRSCRENRSKSYTEKCSFLECSSLSGTPN